MRKPTFGKQRSISASMKRMPRVLIPKSATPPITRPRPKVNKPPSGEIRRK